MLLDIVPLALLRGVSVSALAAALALAVWSHRISWQGWLRGCMFDVRWRRLAALLATAGLAVASATALFTSRRPPELLAYREEEVDPAPALPSRCPLPPEDACAHAHALEQVATARWERVPFAPEEAPRALVQMAEAELCYGALDRTARLHAAGKRRSYEAELTRRFQHARLLLRVARREGRLERARQQIRQLTSLLSRAAAPAGQHYRAQLERLDRAYAAELIEQARTAPLLHAEQSARFAPRRSAYPARSSNQPRGGAP